MSQDFINSFKFLCDEFDCIINTPKFSRLFLPYFKYDSEKKVFYDSDVKNELLRYYSLGSSIGQYLAHNVSGYEEKKKVLDSSFESAKKHNCVGEWNDNFRSEYEFFCDFPKIVGSLSALLNIQQFLHKKFTRNDLDIFVDFMNVELFFIEGAEWYFSNSFLPELIRIDSLNEYKALTKDIGIESLF